MTIVLLFITGLFAGGFGALLGLGGGVIVIPVLTILFHLPIHTTIGISLVGVIATSTGAAITYVSQGRADIRLGMTLELGTTVGAIIGAVVAGFVSSRVLYLLFAAMLVYNTYSMYRKTEGPVQEVAATGVGQDVAGDSTSYKVRNMPLGLMLSTVAGILSGLLGVGGGLVKIPVMYLLMGVPLKVAAATSNFMIGVTAAASAAVYYMGGKIDIAAAAPVAVGVFAGAMIGTRVNEKISTRALKRVFILVFLYTTVEMVIKGLTG